MGKSAVHVSEAQSRWFAGRQRDRSHREYAASLDDNLFSRGLHPDTKQEFQDADGAELTDGPPRPAKMRALVSSSALAVNFFDPWRGLDLTALAAALGTGQRGAQLRFEYRPVAYPVGPRSPNLDVMVTSDGGPRLGIESKFVEPYRARDAKGLLSSKYFASGAKLWEDVGLVRAQRLADRLASRWQYLDGQQLLKHMLGLASESGSPATLLYLWYDTGLEDAQQHRREVEAFGDEIAGDAATFRSQSYQELFGALALSAEPVVGWRDYMSTRYFPRGG